MPVYTSDITLAVECLRDMRTDISVYIMLRDSTNSLNALMNRVKIPLFI